MNRRLFNKKILGAGAAFTAGAFGLPMEAKSQILKPVIDSYCLSYWDNKVFQGIDKLKKAAPTLLMGDTHLHSTHSDGNYSTFQIISRAHLLGLDFLVLTEHLDPIDYNIECSISSFKSQIESVNRLQDMGMKAPDIYPAVEISTNEGHIIVVFPRTYLKESGFVSEFRSAFSICEEKFVDPAIVIARAKKLGGKTIVPHPGECKGSKPFGVPMESLETHLEGLPDGIEDMNTGNCCFGSFGKRLGLSPIGASDSHFKALIGTSVTAFSSIRFNDLTEAMAVKETSGFQAVAVSKTLLKASLFYYSLRI